MEGGEGVSICVLFLTDGRDDLLDRTLESAARMLKGDITRTVIHTDNGMTHKCDLLKRYPDLQVIGGERLGFGGAIDRAWQYIGEGEEQFLAHIEDDFLFERTVDLDAMGFVLNAHPHLIQMALRRQPWSDEERAAGGVVEQWPDEYSEREWEGRVWLEHRLFLTTNPGLWRMDRCRKGWPTVPRSERVYTNQVFGDPVACSGYWGARDSGVWVTHIGTERAGTTY